MTGTESAIIKGGAMLATGGMTAELIIFHDPMYIKLASVGAVVSALGVFYELTHDDKPSTIYAALSEILKGVILGFLAIPFWYLVFSGLGNNLIAKYLEVPTAVKMEKSIWLMISFAMSWYTVPLFNWIVDGVKMIGIKLKTVWGSK